MWLQDIRKSEYVAGTAKNAGVFILMMYVFYESFLPAFVLFPILIMYMREWLIDIAGKKKREFMEQFRTAIQAMASALKAGYAAENAVREAYRDISSIYGKDARIIREFSTIIHQLDMKISLTSVFEGFAARTEQEDVENFVHVFSAAKKSGGDSIAIVRSAIRVISEKIETEKEIETMIAAKKIEFEIMCAVPYVIILYMKATFGEFLSVLYGNVSGVAVMSICLAVYIGAYQVGRKMIRIEV